MEETITILPSSVIDTSAALTHAGAQYTNWASAVRSVDTSSMPPDLAAHATSLILSASAVIADQGASFGAKAIALDKKLKKFIAEEELAWGVDKGNTGLDILGQLDIPGRYESYEDFLEKHKLYGKQLTVSMRLDLYAKYISLPGMRVATVGGRAAWQAVLVEADTFDTKATLKYRKLYIDAVALASRRGGKVTAAAIKARISYLQEKTFKFSKAPKIPKFVKAAKLIPVAGALADGYIGYEQSSGSDWKTRLESGANSAIGNAALDVIPVGGQAVGIYDIGAGVTGNGDYQVSELVRVSADGQVLAKRGDRQGLVTLLWRIKAKKKGFAYNKYKNYSEDQFIEHFEALVESH